MSGGSIIRLACFLTVVWLGGMLYLAGFSHPCLADVDFISRWLSCRTLNELGDFLAGAFAPLAFLWLVATVLIQSASLRRQGDELALAREEQTLVRGELRLSREASEAQLVEVRKNIEILNIQVQMEQDRTILSRQERNDNITTTLFEYAMDQYDQCIRGKRFYTHRGDVVDVVDTVHASGITQRLNGMASATYLVYTRWQNLQQDSRPAISGQVHWCEIHRLLSKASDLLPDCSDALRSIVPSESLEHLLTVSMTICQHAFNKDIDNE